MTSISENTPQFHRKSVCDLRHFLESENIKLITLKGPESLKACFFRKKFCVEICTKRGLVKSEYDLNFPDDFISKALGDSLLCSVIQ